ncbi:hypothetical protein SAMN05216232_3594 [Virgibacillus subterraneus]|uniref:Uncharacterized protein n=1 Tax=Virgibacillus subterraneus TaxID=621109 RepID=A0A1H9JQY7_9BACI|nr:hypothetical protein SAMN05216232_3594 [Virgibacillus subterraneus]
MNPRSVKWEKSGSKRGEADPRSVNSTKLMEYRV